jgi:manganese-dependent inorganic pyrophosphatase
MTAPWRKSWPADLGVAIPDYAARMFEAKSDVSAFSDAELLRMDSKEYEVAGKELRVSCWKPPRPRSCWTARPA